MTETLTIAAALGAGTIGGAFYVFSVMVMPALDRLAPAQAVAAMQQINVVAVTPPFLAVFLGTVPLAIAAAIAGGTATAIAGATLYTVGVVGVTIGFHVPRNDALARGELAWRTYARPWTAGNHARAAAGIVAAALHMAALL